MDPGPADPGRGLSAPELALVTAELAGVVTGARVLDVAMLAGSDDLLVVLRVAEAKRFLHVALGSRRARVVLTERHFGRDEQATGPRADALRRLLADASLEGLEQPPRERRLALVFVTGGGRLDLQVELFSARGLWALCAADGTVLEMSRPVATAVRTLGPGDRYEPPPARAGGAAEPPPRFGAQVLAAVDAHFCAFDRRTERMAEHQLLSATVDRAAARAGKKCEGLREQLRASAGTGALRAEADLILAYMHTVVRGAARMTVPDPGGDGERTIELDPARPVRAQAQARYQRARRLEDGRAMAHERLAATERELETLARLQQQLAAAAGDAAAVAALRRQLADLGLLPKPRAAAPAAASGRKVKKADRRHAGENVRRFTATEGYDILVGRDNRQNDRLTLRIANGNDVWMHVGGGRAGSHVVVRLPKGKTASLDTLLDAGHLAVHFSKARGERAIDVIYTFAKFVRKPKGLPPGAVVPQQTRTLSVRLDEARLRRLLDSAAADG